mgnify:CR=1 FL=1
MFLRSWIQFKKSFEDSGKKQQITVREFLNIFSDASNKAWVIDCGIKKFRGSYVKIGTNVKKRIHGGQIAARCN